MEARRTIAGPSSAKSSFKRTSSIRFDLASVNESLDGRHKTRVKATGGMVLGPRRDRSFDYDLPAKGYVHAASSDTDVLCTGQ